MQAFLLFYNTVCDSSHVQFLRVVKTKKKIRVKKYRVVTEIF